MSLLNYEVYHKIKYFPPFSSIYYIHHTQLNDYKYVYTLKESSIKYKCIYFKPISYEKS